MKPNGRTRPDPASAARGTAVSVQAAERTTMQDLEKTKENPKTGELRALITLSGPIIAAQVTQSAMGFVDTVMSGRVSSVDLAAVAIGASIWHPVFLFMLGVLMAVTPSVAHLHGARRPSEIGHHVRQALLLGLALSLALMVPIRHAGPLLAWLDVDPAAIPLTLGYLEGFSWGLPAIAGFFALRHFSEGLGCTRPSMIVGAIGLCCNIAANTVLIYGKLGFPALGGAGCGWATAFTLWVMFLAMAVIVWRGPVYRESRLFAAWPRPDRRELAQILRLGLPIGCALFIETSIFAIIALLLGSLGADIVAAHQICLSFATLIFMVPMSLSSAISVRVGHALGAGRTRAARRAAYTGIALAAGIALVTSSLSYLFARPVASLYTANPQVAALAVELLLLGALFQLSDAIQVSTAGALRGYKDTRTPMLLLVFAYWGIGMPVGYTLGFTDLWGHPVGAPHGFWIGLIAGLSAAAVLLSLRLKRVSGRCARPPAMAQPAEASGAPCGA